MVQAGSMGIPFVPTLGYANSDVISERDDFTIAPNPFNPSEPMVMAKAITPDVALFHGTKADRRGNVLVKKGGEALMLAQASNRVIVTVEEVVDQVSPNDTSGQFIPAIHVKAVAHAPFGAFPSACPGFYTMDVDEMKKYLDASSSDEAFQDYLADEVFAFHDHDSYCRARGLGVEIPAAVG